ncbi:MAG: isoprenylcysteine carboxylmethyltransferase family protein [Candidatus Omnitrophica bacterium]|nr:isoprenylcysteine carboxylmethyltransferase family protein [Candidatus Omnitrophota bacterium]
MGILRLTKPAVCNIIDKMKKRVRFQNFLIFLAMTASLLLSKFLFQNWKREALDEFFDALGVTILLFGFLFRISARGLKAKKSCNGKKLITDGLYSLIRNPMYFGTLLIGLGVILVIFKWWVFLLFFSIFLLIYIPQINKEEKELSKYFGDEYRLYCEKVPGYFPNILALFRIDVRDYLFLEWPGVKKEIPSLIGVIIAVSAIEIWEDVRAFGNSEYVKELLELNLIVFFAIIFILGYRKVKKDR